MASKAACKSRTATSARARRLRGLGDMFAFIERAGEVARQRRALLRLDDAALKDFAASRADAWHEGGRPWWDLPDASPR